MQVHTLFNPTPDSFRDAQKSLEPNILFFQGQQLENEEEIGNLVWEDLDVSEPEMFASLIAPPPTIVSSSYSIRTYAHLIYTFNLIQGFKEPFVRFLPGLQC